VQEARLFSTYLLQMKKHPIEPSAKIFSIELNQDIKRFNEVLAREKSIDEKQIGISSQGQELLDAYARCEERAIERVIPRSFICKLNL
jgi:hypothetical protein